MAILEKITQLKEQGKTNNQIIEELRQQGISPKEIHEAFSQLEIKSAVGSSAPKSTNELQSNEQMQPSIMQEEPEIQQNQQANPMSPQIPSQQPQTQQNPESLPSINSQQQSFQNPEVNNKQIPENNIQQNQQANPMSPQIPSQQPLQQNFSQNIQMDLNQQTSNKPQLPTPTIESTTQPTEPQLPTPTNEYPPQNYPSNNYPQEYPEYNQNYQGPPTEPVAPTYQNEYYNNEPPYPEESPYQEYDSQYSSQIDMETIKSIAEQIIEDKLGTIAKQTLNLTKFKKETKIELEEINKRLDKIENNFNELQMAILNKVGEFGKDIQTISKEVRTTQDSFSKILNPLTDNIRKLQKITNKESNNTRPKPKLKKNIKNSIQKN